MLQIFFIAALTGPPVEQLYLGDRYSSKGDLKSSGSTMRGVYYCCI